MKRRDQWLGMATHPRSLRARLIVFEPVFGICLARRPSWSLSRVNYGNSDDGDHNLAREVDHHRPMSRSMLKYSPRRHCSALRDQVGLSWKSATGSSRFAVFSGPHASSPSPAFNILQSVWLIEKLRYDLVI